VEHIAMPRFGVMVLLMLLAAPAQAEQFSIRCTGASLQYTLTFDEERKRVIVQTTGGSFIKSAIDSDTEEEIRFHYLPVQPNGPGGVWNRKSGVFVVLVFADASKGTETQCVRIELEPAISRWDDIWPH
jgi:hypothetical protein